MILERWKKFSEREQLLLLGSELERARVWQGQDEEKFKMALERGLELVDLMIADEKWRNKLPMILGLREELTKFYIGEKTSGIAKIYQAL